MQCISNPIEQIFHCPFRNRTTWIPGRVGQKNGTTPVASVVPDECCAIPFNILFEAKPGRMGEHNDPRHMVFCDLSPDRDGMALPVNVIDAQKDNLLPAESPIVRQQDNGLITNRALRQHIPQNGFPLAFIGNPGNRGRNRDQTSFSSTNTFSNRVDGITTMAKADTPAVKASERAHSPPDRRGSQPRAAGVEDFVSLSSFSISSFYLSLPQPIDVISDLVFVGFKQFRKGNVRKGRQEIVEISSVILNGAWGFSLFDELLNESPCDRIFRDLWTTCPVYLLYTYLLLFLGSCYSLGYHSNPS